MKHLLFIVLVAAVVVLAVMVIGCSDKTVKTLSTTPTSTITQTVTVTPTPTSSTTTPVVSPSTSTSSILSEQPDMATYRKYFTELGIGKMPANVTNPPEDLEKNVSVFTAGDQICLYGTIILECQLRTTYYNVNTGEVTSGGGLPKPMTGGFAGWEPLNLPVGKYECKVYVEDILVGVFPFEVR